MRDVFGDAGLIPAQRGMTSTAKALELRAAPEQARSVALVFNRRAV